jgi:hypothetical protein
MQLAQHGVDGVHSIVRAAAGVRLGPGQPYGQPRAEVVNVAADGG